jgi:hypothetical protein
MFNTTDLFSTSNPASSFLQDSYQQTMYSNTNTVGGGALQNQFSNVMNSMQAGVATNAQMGNIGNTATNQMTPQQIAAQMNTGGVMSVLPQLSGSFLPKLMFPIAGLWSLVSGVRAIGGFISGARAERVAQEKFDPSKLAYTQDLNEMYEVSQKWSELGPFAMSHNAYGY